jgi:RHS repeat-associated protein
VDASNNTKLYHYDLRGSTLALTDLATHAITDKYAYTPYGAVREDSGNETPENPFTYNGRDGVVDDGTGLYFMRTRYYAPELMRFIQKDQVYSGTLAEPQSLNRYAYVKGDPIRFVDPNGAGWGVWDYVAGALVVAAIIVAVIALAPIIAAASTFAAAFTGAAALLAWAGLVAGVASGGVLLKVEHDEAQAEQKIQDGLDQESTDADAARAVSSLEDLRIQLNDPFVGWNRSLSVPLARPASTGASDKPAPCR